MTIKEYLIHHDMSVVEFSKKIRVTPQHIHAIMSGIRMPSRKLAKRIEDLTMGKIKKESLRNKEILLQKYYDSLDKGP